MQCVKYTVVCFDNEIKKLVESQYDVSRDIIKRDLNLDFKLEYKMMEKPDILKIDEDNDGIYDLRKTTESDKALRSWGMDLAKSGVLKDSNIIMNPESRSGVSAIGTYWKPNHDILVVGCFNKSVDNKPEGILHCFLHEIGHSLGAQHTSNDLDSIMCYGKIETYDYHQKSIDEINSIKKKYC